MHLPPMIIPLIPSGEPADYFVAAYSPALELSFAQVGTSVVTVQVWQARVLLVAALVGAYLDSLGFDTEVSRASCGVLWLRQT